MITQPLQILPDRNMEVEERWELSRYRDFTGGENRNLLPEFLHPNQLLIALNTIMTPEGVLETRTGKSAVFTTPLGTGGITSIHRFVKESGSKYLVVQHGTSLYHASYDGATQLSGLTVLAGSLSAAKFRSVTWKDQLILTNGVDNVKTYNGSALTDLAGSPPKSRIIKVYGGRLRLVDVSNPNVVSSSALEDPTSWPTLEVVKFRTGDGDTINALSPQNGGMVVAKSRSTWALYGTSLDTYRIPESPITDVIGCAGYDAAIDDGVMLGENNLYRFNLTEVTPVSDTHRAVVENMTAADRAAAFVAAQPFQQRGLVHLGSQVLNLEGRFGGITSWDTLNANCFAVLDGKGDDGSILIGDKDTGMVYKLDNSATDDGTPIVTTIQHSYNDQGVIHRKWWRYFQPEIESLGTINSTISYAFDVDYSRVEGLKQVDGLVDNTMTWGESNWGEANWGQGLRIDGSYFFRGAVGNRISYKVTALDRIRYLGYTTKWRRHGDK